MEREQSISSRPSGQVQGLGWPFGTKWSLIALLLGVLGYGLTIRFGFVAAAAVLLIAFAGHRKFCFPDIRFVGNVRAGQPLVSILAVSVIYLVGNGLALAIGQPREPSIVALFNHLTAPLQTVLVIGILMILPPIVEELTFRHFLLAVLPFKSSIRTARVAIVATALLFTLAHRDYQYLTSYALLFALGVVFARARIRSDGLGLPMALHAYAVAFALICDQVVKRLQG
ncbi:lysostaphin resistance A-like protein [Variovorax sp. M-6]|uniref:CPBP family intramembrane glutamic endopeptidase n=1 Tax=Variovorax sp. M-6 TaxID=3233041 RepID=UPI003F9808C5